MHLSQVSTGKQAKKKSSGIFWEKSPTHFVIFFTKASALAQQAYNRGAVSHKEFHLIIMVFKEFQNSQVLQ